MMKTSIYKAMVSAIAFAAIMIAHVGTANAKDLTPKEVKKQIVQFINSGYSVGAVVAPTQMTGKVEKMSGQNLEALKEMGLGDAETDMIKSIKRLMVMADVKEGPAPDPSMPVNPAFGAIAIFSKDYDKDVLLKNLPPEPKITTDAAGREIYTWEGDDDPPAICFLDKRTIVAAFPKEEISTRLDSTESSGMMKLLVPHVKSGNLVVAVKNSDNLRKQMDDAIAKAGPGEEVPDIAKTFMKQTDSIVLTVTPEGKEGENLVAIELIAMDEANATVMHTFIKQNVDMAKGMLAMFAQAEEAPVDAETLKLGTDILEGITLAVSGKSITLDITTPKDFQDRAKKAVESAMGSLLGGMGGGSMDIEPGFDPEMPEPDGAAEPDDTDDLFK